MNKKDKQKIADYVEEYYKKHPWISGRLWDDDCICESDTVILDNCPNKRCREKRNEIKKRRY